MYCEGTRFTPEKYAKGLEFARKNGFAELKHHLVPRTKGFVLAMEAFDGKGRGFTLLVGGAGGVPVLFWTTNFACWICFGTSDDMPVLKANC